MATMLREFEKLIENQTVSCVDRLELPDRSERSVPVPEEYRQGAAGRWLMNDERLGGMLWLHQAKALEIASSGRNLVISTGTASGKSLVFQSTAFRMMDEDPEAAVIVFYPLKALSNDQLLSWRRAAELAGVGGDHVVKVDGDILRPERARLLAKARVALMTPDVCHAWLLNEISNPAHRTFLSRTGLVVIDEAHVLEGVMGSNFAYLFRRLCSARHLVQGKGQQRELQVIAASATISTPDKHLNALTGLPFEAIGEEDDGAPRHDRSILHIAAAIRRDADVAEPVHKALVEGATEGSFITFVDSRQGAERLAVRTAMDSVVKPYRSGYEASDRSSIEGALRRRAPARRGVDIGARVGDRHPAFRGGAKHRCTDDAQVVPTEAWEGRTAATREFRSGRGAVCVQAVRDLIGGILRPVGRTFVLVPAESIHAVRARPVPG